MLYIKVPHQPQTSQYHEIRPDINSSISKAPLRIYTVLLTPEDKIYLLFITHFHRDVILLSHSISPHNH